MERRLRREGEGQQGLRERVRGLKRESAHGLKRERVWVERRESAWDEERECMKCGETAEERESMAWAQRGA